MAAEIVKITEPGFSMDYAVFGKGSKPLVIIPGMSVCPVIPSADYVASTFRCLCDDYRIYLFDRISDMPSGYTVEDMTEDVCRAMSHADISNAYVYAPSQGAMIAMNLAVSHPEAAGAMVLASTSSRPSRTCTATMERWAALASEGDAVLLNRDVFSRVYSPEFYRRNASALDYAAKMGTAEDLRRFAVEAYATEKFDIYDRLEAIHCPVFVYGVENDTVLGSEGVRDIASKLRCGLYLYPGRGHAAYDEDRNFPSKLAEFFGSI